eukprot:15462911-Alexandrium_andersonii.AAC.2
MGAIHVGLVACPHRLMRGPNGPGDKRTRHIPLVSREPEASPQANTNIDNTLTESPPRPSDGKEGVLIEGLPDSPGEA